MVGWEGHSVWHVVQSWDWQNINQNDTFGASCVFHPVGKSSFVDMVFMLPSSIARSGNYNQF